MGKIMPQLIRSFQTEALGAAHKFVWRVVKEPTYSPLGSPSTSSETVDTIINAIIGTSSMDDRFGQTQDMGRLSPGRKVLHVRPDISLYHGQRTLLAGDEVFFYADYRLEVFVSGIEYKAHIKPEATNIAMVMTYDNVTYTLQDTDYTYVPVSGTITFAPSLSIPVNAAIAITYYYDRYYIEDVNNYGKVYIEVIINKVSRT